MRASMGDIGIGLAVAGTLVAVGFISGVAWYMVYEYVKGAL